jgi:uncharacterized protein
MPADTAVGIRAGLPRRPPSLEPILSGVHPPKWLTNQPFRHEREKSPRHSRFAQPDSQADARDFAAASAGDCFRMGYSHSSTHPRGHGGVFAAGGESAGITAPRELDGRTPTASRGGIGAWILLALVRAYQIVLGPFLGGACKFYPSCSQYALGAIQRHGARRGVVMALRRLGRCHPFTHGGYDPVPDEPEEPHVMEEKF